MNEINVMLDIPTRAAILRNRNLRLSEWRTENASNADKRSASTWGGSGSVVALARTRTTQKNGVRP